MPPKKCTQMPELGLSVDFSIGCSDCGVGPPNVTIGPLKPPDKEA